MFVGTTKHIASVINITMGWTDDLHIIENPFARRHLCRKPDGITTKWSSELEEILRPCNKAMLAERILMTPILIINEKLGHSRIAPTFEKVRKWLLQAQGYTTKGKALIDIT